MNFTVEELYQELERIVEMGRGHYNTGIPATDVSYDDHTRKAKIVDIEDLIDQDQLI